MTTIHLDTLAAALGIGQRNRDGVGKPDAGAD